MLLRSLTPLEALLQHLPPRLPSQLQQLLQHLLLLPHWLLLLHPPPTSGRCRHRWREQLLLLLPMLRPLRPTCTRISWPCRPTRWDWHSAWPLPPLPLLLPLVHPPQPWQQQGQQQDQQEQVEQRWQLQQVTSSPTLSSSLQLSLVPAACSSVVCLGIQPLLLPLLQRMHAQA